MLDSILIESLISVKIQGFCENFKFNFLQDYRYWIRIQWAFERSGSEHSFDSDAPFSSRLRFKISQFHSAFPELVVALQGKRSSLEMKNGCSRATVEKNIYQYLDAFSKCNFFSERNKSDWPGFWHWAYYRASSHYKFSGRINFK